LITNANIRAALAESTEVFRSQIKENETGPAAQTPVRAREVNTPASLFGVAAGVHLRAFSSITGGIFSRTTF
jgi:hypothetical protein